MEDDSADGGQDLARPWGYCSWCGSRDAEPVPAAPGARQEWACSQHRPPDATPSPGPLRAASAAPAREPEARRPTSPDPWMADEAAFRERSRARVRSMSRDLTRSPEEWVGREGHTMALAGLFRDVIDDPEADDALRAWTRRALELLRDSAARRRLQEQHLTPEELEAADRYGEDL